MAIKKPHLKMRLFLLRIRLNYFAAGAAGAAGTAGASSFFTTGFFTFFTFFFLAFFTTGAASSFFTSAAGAAGAAGSVAHTTPAKDTATRAATIMDNTFFIFIPPESVISSF